MCPLLALKTCGLVIQLSCQSSESPIQFRVQFLVPRFVGAACSPSTLKVEVQGHSWLHRELEAWLCEAPSGLLTHNPYIAVFLLYC